jgi:hypothetical protein
MAQYIQDFYTQAQAADFARTFQFRLLKLGNTTLGDNELVYLETASLPGRAIHNQPVPFMGLSFNVPGAAYYPNSDNYAVRFRCDANYNIRALLEANTFATFNDQSSSGNYSIPNNNQTITIGLLNKGKSTGPALLNLGTASTTTTLVRTYTLVGAYVVSVGNADYNLTSNGEIQTVDAVLAYQYWRLTLGTQGIGSGPA